MILVDTGPLVAAANRADAHHTRSVAVLANAKPQRLVGLVMEVSYLLARDAGSTVKPNSTLVHYRLLDCGRPHYRPTLAAAPNW